METFLKLENRHTGEILQMQRRRNSDGQIVLHIDGSLPPGTSGPPLHVHFDQLEEGTVMAGTLGTQIAKEKTIVPAGESAVFPAGVPHKWWNAGDDLLHLCGQATPASDLDRYLQAIFAVVNASPTGRPSLFYLAHVARRHRDTQAVALPPAPVQRVLFPAVLALGHLLGKYRGTNWPGSPESCPGAPEVSTANA